MTGPAATALLCLMLLLAWGWAEPRALIAGLLAGAFVVQNVALGALLVLLVHQTSGGSWGFSLGRELRAAAAALPVAMAGFAVLAWIGYDTLQAKAAGAASGTKAVYLSQWALMSRTVVMAAVWLSLVWLALRLPLDRRSPALGAIGLILVLPTLMLFAFDWLAALSPHWYSSALGLVLAGAQVPAAFAVCLLVSAAEREGPSRRDVARLLLAALLFFAYVAFMEFLIIWSGHLPHEVGWYAARNDGGWQVLLVAFVTLSGAAALLLCAPVGRRSAAGLRAVAVLTLLGHLGWVLWMVLPALGGVWWPAAVLGVLGLGGSAVVISRRLTSMSAPAAVAAGGGT